MTFLDDDLPIAIMKRAMAEPGAFSTTWPGLANSEITGYLADGFSLARLDGWFADRDYDPDADEVTPDLSRDELVLAACYASRQILAQRLMSIQQGVHYKAGPVEYSTTGQSNVLTALLNQAKAVVEAAKAASTEIGATSYVLGDMVALRLGITGALWPEVC